MSLNQLLRSSKESRARGQDPASHALCAETAFEALNRGPRRAQHLPWDRTYLPVTPEQGQLFEFCFVFLSPPICWKNTQTLGQRGPGLAAPAARGPEAKLAEEEAACPCPRAPGTGLDSPSGQWGMCPPSGLRSGEGEGQAAAQPKLDSWRTPGGPSGLLGRSGAFGALGLVSDGELATKAALLGKAEPDHVNEQGDAQ